MQILRPKGYLGATGQAVVLLLIGIPLVMLGARLAALPGIGLADWPLFAPLAGLGNALEAGVTLAWVPEADRSAVEYLLLLPTAALIIALARLTFGLRVLGFRSILIAIGFQEVGILPSLIVMGIVFAVVALLRPGMRRARLPLYGRVSLILAITACLMIAFLFAGMWQRSPFIWSLAFFPVIILAMMAEALAAALDNETLGAAAWRLSWTLLIAFGLYGLIQSRAIDALAFAPELMLLQLGLIIAVSEYLDLRLLQDWQAQSAALQAKYLPWWPAEGRRPRVALVRNRSPHGTIGRLGVQAPPEPARVSMQHLIDALRTGGYSVKVFEGDMTLLRTLRVYLAPHPRTGAPGGVVFNLGEGIQGENQHTHVPAMLEMAGIPYTGPTPAAHALIDDPVLQRLALQHAGIATASEGVHGQELHVGVLGDGALRAFPIVTRTRSGSFSPAEVVGAASVAVRDCAFRAFRATGCRDFAVVRVVLTPSGDALVRGIDAHGIFGRKSSTGAMLAAAGLDWSDIAHDIVELSALRNGVEWTAQQAAPSARAQLDPPAQALS